MVCLYFISCYSFLFAIISVGVFRFYYLNSSILFYLGSLPYISNKRYEYKKKHVSYIVFVLSDSRFFFFFICLLHLWIARLVLILSLLFSGFLWPKVFVFIFLFKLWMYVWIVFFFAYYNQIVSLWRGSIFF